MRSVSDSIVNFVVPVPVARTITESAWFKAGADVLPPEGSKVETLPDQAAIARWQYRTAAHSGKSRWRREVRDASPELLEAMLEGVQATRQELGDHARRAVLEPLLGFTDTLMKMLERAREAAERKAAAERERAAKLEASSREFSRKRRERQMAPVIEVARNAELREVAQDYGLDIKDPQIKAALIAAFRAGAYAFRQAADGLARVDQLDVPDEWIDKRTASDKATFAKARAAAAAVETSEEVTANV
jgi:hypothetical protein